MADKDTKVFGLLREIAAPDRGEDSAMSHYFAAVTEKEDEKIELLRRQMGRIAAYLDFAGIKVDLEITVFEKLLSFVV